MPRRINSVVPVKAGSASKPSCGSQSCSCSSGSPIPRFWNLSLVFQFKQKPSGSADLSYRERLRPKPHSTPKLPPLPAHPVARVL